MNRQAAARDANATAASAAAAAEAGLARRLTAAQQALLGVGAAIGTGIFLGSSLAIRIAGPAVLLSYAAGGLLAVLLALAVRELGAAHPQAGGFGVYADAYLSPFAGFAARVSYAAMLALSTGALLAACAIYMAWWAPAVPAAAWIVAIGLALILLNTRSVAIVGRAEAALSIVKLSALVLFSALGLAALIVGLGGGAPIGFGHFTDGGGFLANGLTGAWLGTAIVVYSFIGLEGLAVSAGEAVDPARTLPRAALYSAAGTSAVYLLAIGVLVGLLPWTEAGTGESPFVRVLAAAHLPHAAAILNLVALLAALSAANANVYLTGRMIFSLARGGFLPRALGALSADASPRAAVLLAGVPIAAAVIAQTSGAGSAYETLLGVSLFGGLFVWALIFASHIVQRRGASLGSVIGLVMTLALLVSTWWAPGLRVTLTAGVPWLALIAAVYAIAIRRGPSRP